MTDIDELVRLLDEALSHIGIALDYQPDPAADAFHARAGRPEAPKRVGASR
jgi:hypothetical protein